jgi:hypothetical protein
MLAFADLGRSFLALVFGFRLHYCIALLFSLFANPKRCLEDTTHDLVLYNSGHEKSHDRRSTRTKENNTITPHTYGHCVKLRYFWRAEIVNILAALQI